MVEAKIAQASVKEAENGLLKLEWVSENMFVVKPYFIRKGMLEDFATETRQALKRLVDKYVQIDKENSNRQTGEPRELHRAGKELKELAERGHDLYKSLFNAVEGDANAEKMKKWLSEQTKEGKQLQIRLSIDSGIYVPWGLIYD